MPEITPARATFYTEETGYRASNSESLLTKLGSMCNFLNTRHIETKRFSINGNYSPTVIGALPFNAVDGIHIFEFNSEIYNVWIYSRVKGSSGTTTLDLKWKAKASSTWATIFTTAPSFTTTASDYDLCGIGDAKTGFTAPVLSKVNFNAGDAIRMDLSSSMGGTPSGCGLIINYRPR